MIIRGESFSHFNFGRNSTSCRAILYTTYLGMVSLFIRIASKYLLWSSMKQVLASLVQLSNLFRIFISLLFPHRVVRLICYHLFLSNWVLRLCWILGCEVSALTLTFYFLVFLHVLVYWSWDIRPLLIKLFGLKCGWILIQLLLLRLLFFNLLFNKLVLNH